MASENQSRPHRISSAFTRTCARTQAQSLQWAKVTVLLICLCVAEIQPAITHTHTRTQIEDRVMSEASRGKHEGLARSSRGIISHSALKPQGSRESCRVRSWRELATRQTTAKSPRAATRRNESVDERESWLAEKHACWTRREPLLAVAVLHAC